ncbi:unnamed protein product [Bursaphelenchus xylophilus]|uniref:(pine wood nematode) hypothetical protein n=1 Tax=Bursaphelenchus xylophilus TaxID=6326 RepID=A0A1I7S3A7_BURXY|nr:unnamed protein product [Bursaphelenchus xylophilus]CAG9116176.1 unnamed protein product [Bursaphelenchus xylophilus]
MGVALVAVALALIAVIVVWFRRHLQLRRQLSSIPSPRSFPVVGHIPITKPDAEGFLEQIMGMADLYPNKPRMVVFWIGFQPKVMIYEAELAEKVFTSNQHLNKGLLYDLLKPWLGEGLLTSVYEQWKPRRKLLTPTFHYDILRNFVHVFNDQSRILVQQLQKAVRNCDVIDDIYKPLSLCALDIICETSMGQSVNAQLEKDSEYVRAVLRINEIIQTRQKNPLLYPSVVFNNLPVGKEHRWALDVLHSFTKKVIDERRKAINSEFSVVNDRLAFLDLLLEMENRGEINSKSIQEEVDTFMFEGHDTTATASTWALHVFGCYPEVQEKVFQEITNVIGDSEDITLDHIAKMKYLECCLKEILRLYPSVPLIARRLGADLELGNHTIPAGVEILINLYLIHRDPNNWDDPEVFKPERFMTEKSPNRNAFAYVPFSAGSRNCIGQRFALMEEKIILCWLLREFQIESISRRDQQRFMVELILRPTDGVKIRLIPRRK